MSTIEVPVDDEVMDFSLRRRSLRFRVDDDVFEAAPDIATDLALEFADKTELLNSSATPSDEKIKLTHSLIRLLLFPESADRFIARLADPRQPIGPSKLGEIIKWLFEEYGMRPTTSDSVSLTGSDGPASGTSSPAITAAAASTSADSVSIGSST